jgi:hypothetical protein
MPQDIARGRGAGLKARFIANTPWTAPVALMDFEGREPGALPQAKMLPCRWPIIVTVLCISV